MDWFEGDGSGQGRTHGRDGIANSYGKGSLLIRLEESMPVRLPVSVSLLGVTPAWIGVISLRNSGQQIQSGATGT